MEPEALKQSRLLTKAALDDLIELCHVSREDALTIIHNAISLFEGGMISVFDLSRYIVRMTEALKIIEGF
jgi:predicted TIM-barrel enzyme